MHTVYKYEIGAPNTKRMIPRGATFLRAGVQQGTIPVVWYQVDTDMPPREVTIEAIGTGHEIPRGATYLDSVQIGPFVWHLYEVS